MTRQSRQSRRSLPEKFHSNAGAAATAATAKAGAHGAKAPRQGRRSLPNFFCPNRPISSVRSSPTSLLAQPTEAPSVNFSTDRIGDTTNRAGTAGTDDHMSGHMHPAEATLMPDSDDEDNGSEASTGFPDEDEEHPKANAGQSDTDNNSNAASPPPPLIMEVAEAWKPHLMDNLQNTSMMCFIGSFSMVFVTGAVVIAVLIVQRNNNSDDNKTNSVAIDRSTGAPTNANSADNIFENILL